MKKLGIIISIMFFATPQMWAPPAGGDVVAPGGGSGYPLIASKKNTCVDMDGDGTARTSLQFVKSKKPCCWGIWKPVVATGLTLVVAGTALSLMWWYGVFGETGSGAEATTLTPDSTTEGWFEAAWKTFQGTYEEGYKLFCQGVTPPTESSSVCDGNLEFEVARARDSLETGTCSGQNVMFDMLRYARDTVSKQIQSGGDQNGMLRQTLHDLCERGASLRECVLPQDVHSVVDSFLDGRSVGLDCGEVLGNIDDAMDMLAAQGGCLTHSEGMASMIEHIQNQSEDCAGLMMRKALEGSMTQQGCGKVALDALNVVAGPNAQDTLCREYVEEVPTSRGLI
jgi:hypothetical protein